MNQKEKKHIKMQCPFCDNELTLTPMRHYNEEEYIIGCQKCGAIGAIYRKKKEEK
jgi:uncharacterized Zn finger protein